MGEKFSWDRLMKRGKGAEEDNTITLVPEKVEGPVAPLKASTVPQQQFKPVTPAAPPVVQGDAPPMNANRAPLVIDWEEFSKEEATQEVASIAVPPVEVVEPPVAPIEAIQPIQIPTTEPPAAPAPSGNFWDQLNKQTQEAMSQPATPTQPAQTPEAPKPVVTGWDDVELTPREQSPKAPLESDIMAGTLDPNGFQPISTYQRPTEEEIRQKTEAIAQSNAWSESTPVTPIAPVPVAAEPVVEPVAQTFVTPPVAAEPPVVEAPVKTEPVIEESSHPAVQTIDVGVSPFANKPPSGHYQVEDPFKPTGNKLLGPDRTPAENVEAPAAPQNTVWNPADEFAAPTGFEKNEESPVAASETFVSEPTIAFSQPVVEELAEVPATFDVVEVETEQVSQQVTTPDAEFSAPVEVEPVVQDINSRVEDMLAAFETPVASKPEVEVPVTAEATFETLEPVATFDLPVEDVQAVAPPVDEFVQPVSEVFEAPCVDTEVFETTQEMVEPIAEVVELPVFEAPVEPIAFFPEEISNQVEQSVEPPHAFEAEVVESVEEPVSSTPADFWANIPGAQAATPANEAVEEVVAEVSTEVIEEQPDVDPDIERDLRTGDLLLKHKLVAPAQLERALARQRATKEKLGQVLISMGLISERRLLQVLASQKGVSPWHLEDDAPSQDAVQLISHETCQLFQVLPVAVRGDMLLLAMRETQDLEAIAAIRSACGKRIEPVLADEVRLAYTIDEAYGVAWDRGESALEQMVAIAHEHEINLSDGTIVNPERPDHLTALLRELMGDAKRKSATSITIGYGDGQGEILYRIHGRLCPVQSVPLELAASVLKTATADLEEQRIPFEIGSDYKVAMTTGQQGDNFVVTFPQAEAKIDSLDQLLIESENLKLLRELTQRPYGLFLVTGSVRSAKQATLKALWQEMERQGRVVAKAPEGENIAEQINLAVTSESEVIVVGELENEADIRAAVKAASSGHLILAEVTANDAPTAIQQLISCGADPYLLATILTGVWSQALAPKLCLNCREAQGLTDSERSLLDHYGMRHIQKVFESHGCESCNHTGVAGQIILSEVLPVSSDVSHFIANKAPVEEMAEQAGFAGYLPMDYDAMTRVIHGDVDFATARRLVLFSLRELSAICRRDTWETQAS